MNAEIKEILSLLKTIKRIHMIGIGGSGMCPIAEVLNSMGYEISGSDNNEGDTLDRIKSLGIKVIMGQRAENIEGAEMIVYTSALLETNPELRAAKESGIPTFERADMLGAITCLYKDCIGVCGTHGKTTVTSMLTQVLLECGKDPSAIIGGRLPKINANGLLGKSDTLVCESCEFKDTFLHLSPDTAIILNVDADHLDYFKTLERIIESFNKFASMTTGLLIINGDDANTLKAINGIEGKRIITFGEKSTNDYYAENITLCHSYAEFDAMSGGKKLCSIKLNVPGRHNVSNSLAVLAAAIEKGCDPVEAAKAVEHFGGAGRRFEKLGEYSGVTIADDYAHHPKELRVTLDAASQMGYKRIWAVFQPFTYSRTYELLDDFAEVLSRADKCVMTEIMAGREINTYNIYTSDLQKKIPGSVWFPTFEEVADYVYKNAAEGDLVITLGCGDVYKIAKLLKKKYENA